MDKLFIVLGIIIIFIVLGYGAFYYFTMRHINIPKYTIVSKINNIEIRDYKPMIVAEVTASGQRKQAISNGFRVLANYIFRDNSTKNKKPKKISMTAPVIQRPLKEKNAWTIAFVMPAKYSLKTLPIPDNKKIQIRAVPAHNAIVIRFSGSISQDNIDAHMAQLKSYIRARSLNVSTTPMLMFYNPPWTLPSIRRNEIGFTIKSKV